MKISLMAGTGTPMARMFLTAWAEIEEEAVAVAEFDHDAGSGLVAPGRERATAALMGGREIRPVSAAGGGFTKHLPRAHSRNWWTNSHGLSTPRWVNRNLIDVHSSTLTVWRYSQPSVTCITARLETNEA